MPNFDIEDDAVTDYKQLDDFMPDRCLITLICALSAAGKTSLLLYKIYQLLHYDKIFLFAKNLERQKYQNLIKTFKPIGDKVCYDVIESEVMTRIIPVSEMSDDNQKLVIFDD